VDVVGEPVHRLGLFLRRDAEPVIGLCSVPVPQLGEVVSERVVIEGNGHCNSIEVDSFLLGIRFLLGNGVNPQPNDFPAVSDERHFPPPPNATSALDDVQESCIKRRGIELVARAVQKVVAKSVRR